jgi:ATP-dependent DNA helicase RecG
MGGELARWLQLPSETEHLEFKSAKSSFKVGEVCRYCAALANEGGGHLILGVSDRPPREVVGTNAFRDEALQSLRHLLRDRVSAHVTVSELDHDGKRVLIFVVASRPTGSAVQLNGSYWMRSGESLVPMPADRLKRILLEDASDVLQGAARAVR